MNMACNEEILIYAGQPVLLSRKRIKNIYLRVSRDGRVALSAPARMPREAIVAFLAKHWAWAKMKQAERCEKSAAQQQYETGDRISVWGISCELIVRPAEGRMATVCQKGSHVLLCVPPHATREQREVVIEGWYRTLLARAIPAVLARCEQVVGKRAKEWHIRKMKTRWGTCNVIAARIWLSLALVKHAPEALEYVVTHELTHLWVRNHGSAFKARMDIYYPDWRRVKKELNRG